MISESTPSSNDSMARPLFVVEFVSRIEGRGLMIVGFTAEQYGTFAIGDSLNLKRPDGTLVHSVVKGIEYPPSVICVGERPADARYGVLIDFEEIPIGTEVFLDTKLSI